jgi:3-hydroxybutyryl-CoA dehydrogenase
MAALSKDIDIAVIGAGTMGAGIAQVAAQAGHRVRLYDVQAGAVAKGVAGLKAGLDRLAERGKLSAAERDAILSRLQGADSLAGLKGCGLVIEAVVERLDVKRALFKELEGLLAADAILASNTSSLSITEIGAALARPERCVGMHFFNPAPIMALVEVVTGLATAPEVARAIADTATEWGKSPILCKSTPGFVANRIARPFYGEAMRLVEEGAADVPTVDAILKDCGGFRMGPFELMDLIGVDVNLLVTQSVWQAFFGDPRYAPSLMQQEMVAAGRYGRKSGRGWYDYREGAAKPAPSEAPAGPKPRAITLSQNPELAAGRGFYDPAAELAALARNAGIAVELDTPPPEIEQIERLDVRGGVQLAAANDPDLSGGLGFEMAQRYDPFAETVIQLDEASLKLTRGLPVHERGWHGAGDRPVVLYDLALDYARTPRIAIAAEPGAPRAALAAAAGFFQTLGKKVSIVEDVPGLVVMRVLALLANEAAEAVYRGICGAGDADTATLKGLNYPAGPLAWGKKLGWHRIHGVLTSLREYYGDPRYRESPLIRRWDAAAESSYVV